MDSIIIVLIIAARSSQRYENWPPQVVFKHSNASAKHDSELLLSFFFGTVIRTFTVGQGCRLVERQRGKSHRAHADSLAIDLDLQLLPVQTEYQL